MEERKERNGSRIIIPAGWDHHNHLFLYYLIGKGIDISEIENKKEALTKIGDSLGKVSSEVVIVTGWTNAKFELSRSDLEVFPRPMVAFDTSFHGARINLAAENYLAFPEGTPGVLGNGMFVEQAIYPIFDRLSLSVEENKTGLLAMQKEFFSQGIVGVDEMFVNSVEQVQAYDELVRSGQLKLTMKLFFRPRLIEQLVNAGKADLLQHCDGLKLVLDGAFGVRTAALTEPYSDDPRNQGMLLSDTQTLMEEISYAVDQGIDKVAVHAIGERAIGLTLYAYRCMAKKGINTKGWRIEHAELIVKRQALLAKKLGLVLSMQPNFGPDECVRFADRLGDRIYRLNPFRMLIDECGFVPGEDLVFGSDGMPTGYLHGLRCAVNGFTPAQSVTLQEAIRAYVAYGPAVTFADLIRGSNYVVLDGDPLDENTKVLETFVDGQEVYSAS